MHLNPMELPRGAMPWDDQNALVASVLKQSRHTAASSWSGSASAISPVW